MGTVLFLTRCWTWTLVHHWVRRFQIQNVSPVLPYLPNSHLLTSPTVLHFYSSLPWCDITLLCLLASMLYDVQCKTLFEYNETYAPISLSQTRNIPAPSDNVFSFFFLFKSNPLCPYICGTQLLVLMMIFNSGFIFL